MGTDARIEGSAIVLVGSFNPAIVQPRWLASMDLLGKQEADSADIELISPQVTQFAVPPWLAVQVLSERFLAEALDSAHDSHLLNLVTGIYSRLEHTPITKLGLVWRGHFELASEAEWHALGDRFAPKDLWREVVTSPIRSGTPGLRTLVIEGNRQHSPGEWLRVKVEPSIRLRNGVFVELHEQFDGAAEHRVGAGLIETLREQWEEFLRESRKVATRVLAWGGGA